MILISFFKQYQKMTLKTSFSGDLFIMQPVMKVLERGYIFNKRQGLPDLNAAPWQAFVYCPMKRKNTTTSFRRLFPWRSEGLQGKSPGNEVENTTDKIHNCVTKATWNGVVEQQLGEKPLRTSTCSCEENPRPAVPQIRWSPGQDQRKQKHHQMKNQCLKP